jgi:hypothetical protein
MSLQTQNRGVISVKGKYKFRFTHIQTPYRDIVLFIVLLFIKRKMDFALQIELTAQETAQRVYKNFFQCAISRTEPNSANNVLTFLLNKKDFIISMCRLLNRKINVDNYLNKIVDICVKANCEMLRLNELDKLLIAHNLERNISHKLHVIKLLSGFNLVDAYRLEYPVKNILKNNKDINACIDEFICRAAHLADSQNLETFTQALLLNNTSYKFKPLENQTHAAIMTWLMKNISKGKNDSEAMLGWRCGPDSAKWQKKKVNFEPSPLHMLRGFWSNWTQLLITNWGRCKFIRNQIWIIFLYSPNMLLHTKNYSYNDYATHM